MSRRWIRRLVVATLLLAGGIAIAVWVLLVPHRRADAPGWDAKLASQTLEVGGLAREFQYYLPPGLAPGAPIVFVLHGSGGNPRIIRAFTDAGFERIAVQAGAIVVYPQGFENHWNDCRGSADYAANTRDIDDPAFFAAMIDWFEREHGADRARVLVFGHSNGAHMGYRLALERPELVRAVVAVSGGLPAPATRDCKESGKAVAIAIVNGTEDPINPFAGGLVTILGNSSRGEVLSSAATARYWAALAGYAGEPVESELPDRDPGDGTRVRVERWQAPGRPEVAHYVVEGGGHTIPSQTLELSPVLAGRTSHDFDAVREAWEFFRRQWP